MARPTKPTSTCSRCGKDIRGEPVTFTVDGRTLHYHPAHAPTVAPGKETELDRLVQMSNRLGRARFLVVIHARGKDRIGTIDPSLDGARAWAEREVAEGYADTAFIVDKDLRQGARGVVWRSEPATMSETLEPG